VKYAVRSGPTKQQFIVSFDGGCGMSYHMLDRMEKGVTREPCGC
jgi:hypothetical protein